MAAKHKISVQVADFEVVGLRKAEKHQKQDFSAGLGREVARFMQKKQYARAG